MSQVKTKQSRPQSGDPHISLSQQAYDYLSLKLMSNELAPGDLLNRRQVAEELNISVAPVLEAIVQLESDGFLESIPRKGTRVRGMRMDDLKGQLILREALECEAARIYSGERVKAELDKLQKLALNADEFKEDDREAWRVESDFHCALVELAEIPALMDAFQVVMRKKLFIGIQLYQRAHPQDMCDCHIQLLERLVTVNSDEAEKLLRKHIRVGREALFRNIS